MDLHYCAEETLKLPLHLKEYPMHIPQVMVLNIFEVHLNYSLQSIRATTSFGVISGETFMLLVFASSSSAGSIMSAIA